MAAIASKKSKNRKALKELSSNELNASAGKNSSSFAKSKDVLSAILSPEKSKKNTAFHIKERSLADELEEVKRKLKHLRIEKERTEELLKERDAIIKSKEEELENRAKEQEKLQKEIKKLQKLKEFNPTMNLPIVKSLREKEQEKNKKLKKPSSAYILWSKDQWNEVKKDNPDAEFKDIPTILGAKWKILNTEDKKPYEEKYIQEKMVYLQLAGNEKRETEALKLLEEEQMQKTAIELLEQYLQFKQEADNAGGKKSKKEKDPLKPKKPMSAFFLFVNKRRPELLEEKKTIVEISKMVGEEWKNMTDEEKAPYEQNAKLLKEEYNNQIEVYKQNKLQEAANQEKEEMEQKKYLKQEALQLLKKKEKVDSIIKKTKEDKKKQKEEKKSDPNKPKKPPTSFLLFSKETKKELRKEKLDIGNSTLNAMISVKWKELNDEDKMIWNERANEGMSLYKKEMEEYNNKSAAFNHEATASEE